MFTCRRRSGLQWLRGWKPRHKRARQIPEAASRGSRSRPASSLHGRRRGSGVCVRMCVLVLVLLLVSGVGWRWWLGAMNSSSRAAALQEAKEKLHPSSPGSCCGRDPLQQRLISVLRPHLGTGLQHLANREQKSGWRDSR